VSDATGYHITVSVSDSSGNYNLDNSDFFVIVNPPPDTSAPAISYTINGVFPPVPDGNNDWYTIDAFLDWTVTEPESPGSLALTDCTDSLVNYDTTGDTFSCAATSDGGSSGPVSVTIKRDATAPTISGSATPAPNSDGWNNADVTVSFTCGDATSLIASCSADTVLGEGEDQSVTGTATDNAGNTASTTVDNIDIDKTAPGITGEASPLPNANGWNNADVTVTFTCTDGLSGIKQCTDPITLSSEGAGQSATGTAVDYADNSASVTVEGINIDKTNPTIVASRSPDANIHGWNNGAVTVHFECSDSLSGIDICPADTVLSGEGAGQSASGTAYDMAGNSASDGVTDVNIDLTDPTVSLSGGPADGGSYYFGFVPGAPSCTAADGLSGLDGSCSVSGYGTTVGTHTVSANAADKAGNTNSESHTYTVLAWTLSGFFQPVDNNGVFNTLKSGQGVPLKWNVMAGGTEITDPAMMIMAQKQIACPTNPPLDSVEETAATAGGSTLTYDPVAHQFKYVWKSPSNSVNTCWKLTMTSVDASTLIAYFKLVK
jgi:hypothetical protein